MKNNESDYEALYSCIEKIIEEKVCEIIDKLGIEASDFGTVVQLDDYTTDENNNITSVSYASIMLPSGEVINSLFNSSGEILKIEDKVKIFGSRKNMSNRYIGAKYE